MLYHRAGACTIKTTSVSQGMAMQCNIDSLSLLERTKAGKCAVSTIDASFSITLIQFADLWHSFQIMCNAMHALRLWQERLQYVGMPLRLQNQQHPTTLPSPFVGGNSVRNCISSRTSRILSYFLHKLKIEAAPHYVYLFLDVILMHPYLLNPLIKVCGFL